MADAVLGKLEDLAGGTLAEVPHELGVVWNLAPACELNQETEHKSPTGTWLSPFPDAAELLERPVSVATLGEHLLGRGPERVRVVALLHLGCDVSRTTFVGVVVEKN